MDIEVTRFVRFENAGALQAFCDVRISGMVLIKGIRIVEGRTGPFVTMPRQQSKNSEKWFDCVALLDNDLRNRMNKLILEAYASNAQLQTIVKFENGGIS